VVRHLVMTSRFAATNVNCPYPMIKNYFLVTFRSLWKNRSHTIINMLGLSLGITCSILIFLIIRFELSFDSYHPDADRIYRLIAVFTGSDKPSFSAGMTYPLPPQLRQDFADPEYVVTVDANLGNPVITISRTDGSMDKYKEERVMFTDPEYFKMFRYEWIEGNDDALLREKTVVLTESIAKKYFGDESAMNKVIRFNNEYDVTVSGVVKDVPLNTDLPFQIILTSRLGANKRGWDGWGSMSSAITCFVKLNPQVSLEEFNVKLDGWHRKYFTGNNEEDGKTRRYFLQPLSEIHFDTRTDNYNSRVVSYQTLLTLGLIGVLLLLTACINFVNLNTVLIINRSKETGIRKVMGSTRFQLVNQFLGETFSITLISLLLSAGLVELALIYLAPVLGYRLSFHPFTDPVTTLLLVILPFIVTLLAGLYPGLRLASFQPVKALKSKLTGTPGKGLTLRRSLIVFQLVISQVLVISTIVVIQQINHFMAQPIGLSSESVVEFELPQNKPEIISRLRDRLQNLPGIENAAMSNTGAIGNNNWGGDYEATVDGKLVKANTQVKIASEDYVKTYQLTLLHGEDLVRSDTATRFVVNESFARTLGFKNSRDAIGIPVDMWGHKAMITGIVKDYNTNSLKDPIRPVIILAGTRSFYVGAVRIKTENLRQTLAEIQKTWEEVYPNFVFEYTFLDETIARFYDAERRNSYLFGIFAGVAIFIGCIGLFGLVSFMARSKTKEVGIRKTLGASAAQVIILFSREFVMLILISFVIAVPVAYYFMEEWLSNFAYRVHPGIITFLIGVTVTFIVVLSTVGIKSYKAAIANPVDALRDE
jgi:putative ABC transport system permease protein